MKMGCPAQVPDARAFGGPRHAEARAVRMARAREGMDAEEEAALRAICEVLLRPRARSAGPRRAGFPSAPRRPTQPRAPSLATASRMRARPPPATAAVAGEEETAIAAAGAPQAPSPKRLQPNSGERGWSGSPRGRDPNFVQAAPNASLRPALRGAPAVARPAQSAAGEAAAHPSARAEGATSGPVLDRRSGTPRGAEHGATARRAGSVTTDSTQEGIGDVLPAPRSRLSRASSAAGVGVSSSPGPNPGPTLQRATSSVLDSASDMPLARAPSGDPTAPKRAAARAAVTFAAAMLQVHQ